jgi:hypothetical protein
MAGCTKSNNPECWRLLIKINFEFNTEFANTFVLANMARPQIIEGSEWVAAYSAPVILEMTKRPLWVDFGTTVDSPSGTSI